MNSDHSSILLTISEKIIMKEQTPTLVNKYTDWKYFNHLLENETNLMVPLKATNQLEVELVRFTTAI